MRILTLLIVLQAVVVQPPSTKIIATLQNLHDLCGSGSDFDACTLFVAYRLNVKCAASSGATTMNASVTFRPLIFLYNIRQLTHELLHIDDVQRFASEYVDGIDRMRFTSAGDCESAAGRLRDGFGETMRGFARRSNLERHPTLRRLAGTD